MPTAICFIERKRNQKRIEKGSDEWESGDWDVSPAKAQTLIGKRIYFHEKQADPSYFGGIITGFHICPTDNPKSRTRIVFAFIRDNEGSGFSAGSDGWRQDQKTIP